MGFTYLTADPTLMKGTRAVYFTFFMVFSVFANCLFSYKGFRCYDGRWFVLNTGQQQTYRLAQSSSSYQTQKQTPAGLSLLTKFLFLQNSILSFLGASEGRIGEWGAGLGPLPPTWEHQREWPCRHPVGMVAGEREWETAWVSEQGWWRRHVFPSRF